MNDLHCERTKDTPGIRYTPDGSVLVIEGESYPENAFAFYTPVLEWLDDYLAGASSLTLRVRITYMNSSSTKCTFDILDRLQAAFGEGKKIKVVWEYDADNPRAQELAEDFREDFTFPFDIVQTK